MSDPVTRREFLRRTAAVATATAAVPALTRAAEEPAAPTVLPTRKLGRTGVEVTMLNLGTAQRLNTRLLNATHDNGVRYIDTADCYEGGGAEKAVGEWLAENGRRKEYFVVTKDHPRSPDEWVSMLDRRLEALKVDQVDLFFLHCLGDGEYPAEANCGADWPKSKEWAAAADKMKKSGKTRFVGFSSHCKPIERRIAALNNAAEGGWVDALMVAVDPKLIRDNAELNKALDACHNAGVGLISMKEVRGGLGDINDLVPDLRDKGLTPHTAVLSAIWTDGRFASICSHMDNIKKLTENSEAARKFKPLNSQEMGAVYDMLQNCRRTFCHGCDGSCQRAAGTQTAFADITRYLAYYEQDGRRAEARALFAALPREQREWIGADLCAASRACVGGLDFRELLHRAAEKLA